MTTIAIGVVFVLLLGEIDLSIGYVSGIAGVVVAKLQFPDGSWETTGIVAIIVAVIVTALIGLFQGSFVAIIGVPSFVVTLAGLLFWQGVILYSIGDQGVIVIDDSHDQQRLELLLLGHGRVSHRGGRESRSSRSSTLAGVVSRRRHAIFTDNLIIVALKLIGCHRRRDFGAILVGERRARVPGRLLARDRAAALLDLGRGADDLRPARLRRRRERRGRTPRRDQRPPDPDPGLHDLRARWPGSAA